LTWSKSTGAVASYQIERCSGAGCTAFAQISTSTSTTFSDTGLTVSTSYSYRVRAADSAGNLSGYSNTASATTPALDTQPPTAPSSLTATAANSNQINLSWTASTDNVAVTGYRVERCSGAGCTTFAQIATPTSTTFSDIGLTASTSYSYRVRAADAAGNLSGYSPTATATTTAGTTGTIKFIQGNFQAPQSSPTSVAVTYTAAQSAGDLNIVVVGWNDASTTIKSVTDTIGNVYTLAVGPTVQPGPAGGGGLSQAVYYAKNIASANANGNAVTVSFNTAAAFPDVRILEYSGLNATSPLDVTAAAVGNSATSSSGTATTTSASELLVAANMVFTGTSGAGTGFTSRMITNPDGDIVEDRIVTATGSYQATAPLSGAGPWIMQMAGFRAP
jgi:chitodextrinase